MDLTAFGRFGWNNGKTKSYAFTEIDQTFAGGLGMNGRRWKRRYDRCGRGLCLERNRGRSPAVSGIGWEGLYLRRRRVELLARANPWRVTTRRMCGRGCTHRQASSVVNPGYNQVRGPVVIPTFRVHVEL